MSDPRTPVVKRDRREAAREKARLEREAEQRKAKRRRLFLQGGIAVAIIAVALVVALVVINVSKPPGPGPKNMADDGIIIGKGLVAERTGALAANATPKQRAATPGVIAIRAYEDFQCPNCLDFENTNAAYIKTLIDSGKATYQLYPVAILDSSSNGNMYSTRSANAAACVSNFSPDQFYEFHRLLYANQPPENGTGMTDAQLSGYAADAKVKNLAEIKKCITGQTFKNWVGVSTDRFSQPALADSDAKNRSAGDQVNYIGTPTVIVNGKWFKGSITDAAAFQKFVESASTTTGSTPSATPSASAG